MLGDVATATASDWFRLTRQIGTKQLKTQVRLPVGGGRRVQGGAAGRANPTPGAAPASTAAAPLSAPAGQQGGSSWSNSGFMSQPSAGRSDDGSGATRSTRASAGISLHSPSAATGISPPPRSSLSAHKFTDDSKFCETNEGDNNDNNNDNNNNVSNISATIAASVSSNATTGSNTVGTDFHKDRVVTALSRQFNETGTSSSSSSSTSLSSTKTSTNSTRATNVGTNDTTESSSAPGSTLLSADGVIVIDFRRYLVDVALEILLGTKPDHVKIMVLVFLQEECLPLFRDEKILWCFFTTAKSMLTHPRAFSSLIRGQMLVTATTILIEVDTINVNASLFRSFVILLHSVAADTFNASTCYLRQMACESLRELELIYPTLLAEFVNETLSGQPASALPASASSLLRFFQEERSHISQSYALLYLTVLEHAVAEDEEEDVVGGFESPGGNSASLKQEEDTEDLLFDGDGEGFDRRSSSGNEEDYDESRNSGSDTYSDDGSYGEGEDRSSGASEEERLLGDLSNVESGESSGRDSYFDEDLVQNTRMTGQVYAQQSQVSGFPATPVSRVDFLGSPLDDAVSENRRMMEEEEEAAKDDGAAAQPLTTALTASLGNVPTPILREAIAGLVHQLASTIKRPGYNVPEKSAVMIRPVSPSKFLCSHFPPSMLDFADNRPRDAGEDQDLAGQTGGHLKKKKKKKSRRETSRTYFDSVVKKLTRALSLVLENSTLFSQWGLVHMITKIVPFSRRMGLQPSIFRHHFYGMAFTQSPLLYHIVILLHNAVPGVFSKDDELVLLSRLSHMTRDPNVSVHQRLLGLQWLLCFPARIHDEDFSDSDDDGDGGNDGKRFRHLNANDSTVDGSPTLSQMRPDPRFLLLHAHHADLYPTIFEPLALREAKLQALLHCFAMRSNSAICYRDRNADVLTLGPPKSFLRSLQCLLEYQYHAPHGRYAMAVFRLLFQVLVRFPQLCRSVQSILQDTMLYGPRFVPVVIQLIEKYVTCGSLKAAENMQGRFEGLSLSSRRLKHMTQTSSSSTGGGDWRYRSRSGLGPTVSSDDEAVISRVSCFLLSSFGSFIVRLQPSRRLERYFPLMERILLEHRISPAPTLHALARFLDMQDTEARAEWGRGSGTSLYPPNAYTPMQQRSHFMPVARGDWITGRRLLAVCRAALVTHPTPLVYGPLHRILRFVIAHFGEVDTRDHAWLLLQMLTHLSKDRLSSILCGVPVDHSLSSDGHAGGSRGSAEGRQSADVGWSQPLAPSAALSAPASSDISHNKTRDAMSNFRPQLFEGILKTQPIQFLHLRRALSARRKVGLRDGGSADIMVLEPEASRKEIYCIESLAPEDDGLSMPAGSDPISTVALLSAYGMALWSQKKNGVVEQDGDSESREGPSAVPQSIHLPLFIQFREDFSTLLQQRNNSGKDHIPDRIYSIVLEFSPSPNCVPLNSITLPFLCAPLAAPVSALSASLTSDGASEDSRERGEIHSSGDKAEKEDDTYDVENADGSIAMNEEEEEEEEEEDGVSSAAVAAAGAAIGDVIDAALVAAGVEGESAEKTAKNSHISAAVVSGKGGGEDGNDIGRRDDTRNAEAFDSDFESDSGSDSDFPYDSDDQADATSSHFNRFPYMYQLLLPIRLTNPAPTRFQVRVMYNDASGRTCEGPLADVQLCFQDLFLRLPVASVFKQWDQSALASVSASPRPSNAQLVRLMFDVLWEAVQVPGLGLDQIWNATGDTARRIRSMSGGPAESVKVIEAPRRAVEQAILRNLGPFIVLPKQAPVNERGDIGSAAAASTLASAKNGYSEYQGDLARDAQALEDEEERWYAVGGSKGGGRSDSRHGSTAPDTHGENHKGGVTSVVVFVPPRFHLLLKFHVSDESTVVRIRTDNWKLLSELDAFFDRWDIC